MKIQNTIANKSRNSINTRNREREKIKEYNQFLKNKYNNLGNKGFDGDGGGGDYNTNTEVIN